MRSALFVLLAAATSASAQTHSIRLFEAEPGYNEVWLHGLSSDGSVASGYVRRGLYQVHTIRIGPDGSREVWNQPSDPWASISLGVSGDGSSLVGWASPPPSDDLSAAYRRTGAGPIQHLPALSGFPRGQSNAASHDGGVIVGSFLSDPFESTSSRGFVWSQEAGLRVIQPWLQGGAISEVTAVSGDGRTAVGSATRTVSTRQAFVWTEAGGVVALPGVPGSPINDSRAGAITTDGRTVAGRALAGVTQTPLVRWDDGVITVLGSLPGYTLMNAHDISDDGGVIVGAAQLQPGISVTAAFAWSAATGVMPLADFFRANGLEELPHDWNFVDCRAVSADGLTFAGTVRSSTFDSSGFIITIPGPGTAALAILAGGSTFRRRRTVEAEQR